MAVTTETITSFEDWYDEYRVDSRDGTLIPRGLSPVASTYRCSLNP